MAKFHIFLLAIASASVEAFLPTSLAPSPVRAGTELFMNKKKSSKKKKSSTSSGQGFGGVMGMAPKSSFPYAGSIRPGVISEQRVVVDENIISPSYALDGVPKEKSSALLPWIIEVKTPEEIVKMRAAGKLAREVLDLAGRAVAPGVTTDEIDTIVHEAVVKVRLPSRRFAANRCMFLTLSLTRLVHTHLH